MVATRFRTFLTSTLVAAWLCSPAAAQTVSHAVHLDLDRDPATGCVVATPSGTISGIEARITATVAGSPPLVTGVVREDCRAGAFTAPQAQPAGHPVGRNVGTAGSDVVEYASSLQGLSANGAVAITFSASSARGSDITATRSVFLPGLSGAEPPATIPSAGLLALILLAAAMLWLARRHASLGTTVALLLLLGAGVVWAANFVTDGAIGDWAGTGPQASDARGDSSSGEPTIDIVAAFAATENGRLFLRADVFDAENQVPSATAQSVSVAEEGSVTITLAGTDPDGQPLTFAIATPPTRGSLGAVTPLSATTASVVYTGSLDQEGSDSFAFTVSDGTSVSAPATVSITLTPVNDAPVVAAQSLTVVENSPNGTVVGTATANDVDAGQTRSWAIIGGNTASAFAINASSGAITVADSAAVVPGNSPFALQVRATDNGTPPLSGTATITLTVTGVNDPPSFTAGPNQSVNEDAAAQSIAGWATAISAGPADESAQQLQFLVSNDNTALFASQPAVSPAGTLSFTPAPNANGTATVSVVLQDNGGVAAGGTDRSPAQTFTISVAAINDAPGFALPQSANRSVLQDSGAFSEAAFASAISAGPADEAATQTVSFTVDNDNAALFSVQPAITPTGTLSFTPATGAVGSAQVSVTLVDSGSGVAPNINRSTTLGFTISIAIVNQPPTFDPPADPPAVDEDAAAQTLAGFVANIQDGDASVTQAVSFSVTGNSNPGLFSVAPSISPAGVLSYTPAPNANGSATITFVAVDNGGTTVPGSVDTSAPDTFVITVNAVNDAPSFSLAGNRSVPQDSPAQSISGFASAISAGPADEAAQTLGFSLSNTSNALFTVQPAISSDGTLTFTPAAGAVGTTTVSVTLADNGSNVAPNVNTSPTQTFTITLEDVNEAPQPTAAPASPVAIGEDAALGATLTTLSPNDPDVGQSHTYSIVSGNTGNAFTLNASGVLSVAAALDFETTPSYTLLLRATDNGTPPLAGDISVQVNVGDRNDAPVVTAGGTLAFTEGDGPAVLDGSVTVSDVDAGASIASATVRISAGYSSGNDVLGFVNSGGISGSFDAGIGTLSLSGSASPAAYQAALRSVTFSNGSNAPSTAARTVSWSVNDGTASSNVATSSVSVTTTNSDPVLTASAGTTAYTENAAPVAIDTGITASDPDSSLASGATISIVGGLQSGEDALGFSNTASITGLYDVASGVLTLSGSASIASYQAALRSVTYVNTSDTPNTGNRTLRFVLLDDLGASSNGAEKTVSVTPANDAPTVTLSGITTGFTEGGGAVLVDAGLTLSDPDSLQLSSATVSLVAAPDGGSETLVPINCTGLSVSGTNPLSISGTASLDSYETCLKSVTYSNASMTPTTSARSVRFVVSDGTDTSANADKSLSITAVNSAPENSVPGAQTTNEDTALTFSSGNGNLISLTDADAGSGAVDVALTATNGTLDVANGGGATLTGDNSASVTISGTLTQVNAALATVVFTPTQNYFGAASVQMASDDNGNTGGGVLSDTDSIAITVNSVNDAPTVIASPAESFDTVGNTALQVAATQTVSPAVFVSGNLVANFTDIDGPVALSTSLANANGHNVTVNSDGSFVFVPAPAASNPATFTYSVTDGGAGGSLTRTVTVDLFERVWYVKNDASSAGANGTSSNPFVELDDVEGPSLAGDIIFVHVGNGTSSGQSAGVALKQGQRLWGEFVGLAVPVTGTFNGVGNPTVSLVPASAQRPVVSGNAAVRASNLVPREVAGLSLAGIGAGSNAIDVSIAAGNAATGTLTLRDNVVTAAVAEGIDLNFAGTGAITLAVRDSSLTSTGNGLDIDDSGTGQLTITAFDDLVVEGNTAGSGIAVASTSAPHTLFDATPGGAVQAVPGGTTRIGQSGNGIGGAHGMQLNQVAGALDYGDLDIVADAGNALTLTGVSPGFFFDVANGAGSLAATGGAAAVLNTVNVDLQLAALSSSNSATQGVSLTAVTGTFSAAVGSSISNATGTDFAISGGTATVSYAGTITDDVGQLVTVANSTGGVKTFSGPISDGNDGDGSGISLSTNTGATIRFTGGLQLSTGGNPAFVASGGGTVEVCDEAVCNPAVAGSVVNTLTTTTATALSVTSTAIGANDLEFRSINVDGNDAQPTNGIVLSSTGSSGGLTVRGSGGAGSGGTLRDTAGDAISLTSTEKFGIDRMLITSNLGNGIGGSTVHGFVVSNTTISDNGDSDATDDSGIDLLELTGTAAGGSRPTALTGNTISNNFEFEVQITNTTGTLTNLTMAGNALSADGNQLSHGNLMNFLGLGSASMTLTVSSGTFTGNIDETGGKIVTGSGLQCDHSGTAATVTCNVSGADFLDNNVGFSASAATGGGLSAAVTGVDVTGVRAHGVNHFINVSGTAAFGARLENSLIGTASVAGSGSQLGFGVRMQNESATPTPAALFAMTGTTVQESASFSLFNVNQGIAGQGSSRATQVTASSNTFRNSAARAIIVQQNNATDGDSAGATCVNIGGNTFSGIVGNVGDGTEIRLRRLDANSGSDQFRVTQSSSAALASENGLTPGDVSLSGTLTFNGGTCATP